MTGKTSGGSGGLLDSLTVLAATLVAIAQTRLDLLSADLEEERERLLSLLVLILTGMFCLGVGVVLAGILLVVLFWDTHRILLLGALAGVFLAGGVSVWLFAMHKARTGPRMFSASLSELSKDRQQLVSRT